eukprot:2947214-Pyramimonas_sp.AAC.1
MAEGITSGSSGAMRTKHRLLCPLWFCAELLYRLLRLPGAGGGLRNVRLPHVRDGALVPCLR